MENLNAKVVDVKLDHFFIKLKVGAKVNLAFGFLLNDIEDGIFRISRAHENKTLLSSIQTCVQEVRVGKAKGHSQQNWRH